jgi:hypothetical protein
MINDLMEAIHEVPEILSDWDRPGSSMETMLLHLSSFDAEAWKQKLSHLHDANVIDLPKLVAIFQDKMDSLDDG